jgi:hypothetical protein
MSDIVCQDNIDPLYGNYFKLVFNRGTETLELLIQKTNLPGVTILDQPQPTIFGTTIPIPTLAIQYDTLTIEFIVDKNLENWKSLYSWIRNLSNIEDSVTYNIDYSNWHSTATLIIPSSENKYNCPVDNTLTVTFAHIIPVKLFGLAFQSDSPDAPILKCSCTFKYSYYTLDPDAPANLS